MSNQNFVLLRGVNLTRDAETINAGNKPVVKFGVAVNNGYKDSNTGEWVKTDPDFFDVESWNVKGDLFPLLVKGARVAIVGELKYQAWQDKDGGKRSRVVVRALTVDVIQRTDTGHEQQAPAYQQAGQPAVPQFVPPGYQPPDLGYTPQATPPMPPIYGPPADADNRIPF